MSPIDDSAALDLRYTDEFLHWRAHLKDRRAASRIATRLERLQEGHWGDVQSVGGGVTELRLHFGPGYRLYVTRRGLRIVVLLCGGDKSSQRHDIVLAKRLSLDMDDAS